MPNRIQKRKVADEKSQSKTIHIGNEGEYYLALQLARHCIVRDVGQGKDTGIDLYSEIVQQPSLKLSLHFFCQVKTQKTNVNVSRIDAKYWTYWGNQPVPVFLFLIKYESQDRIQESEIWVYDIPYILTKIDAKNTGQKVPRRDVQEKFKIGDRSNNKDEMTWNDFIYHHVPWSYGLWNMRRFGLVLPNPGIGNQQKNKILVGGFSYLYERKIRQAMQFADWLMKYENISENN